MRLIETSHEVWKNDDTNANEHAIFYARNGRAEAATALDFEIAPTAANSDVLRVHFRGAPLANAELHLIAPNGEETELTTDAQGQVNVPAGGAGRYLIAASTQHAEARTVQRQQVSNTWHITTLTFTR